MASYDPKDIESNSRDTLQNTFAFPRHGDIANREHDDGSGDALVPITSGEGIATQDIIYTETNSLTPSNDLTGNL
jgi:hypothetical protein